jgi:lysophospholipase L1-like esterase
MTLPRLFVLGDSISIQYGPYLEQYLAGRYHYARKAGTELALQNLDNAQGANGGDSSQVLAYLKAMQANGGIPADVLLLNCGLHDLRTIPATDTKQVTPDTYEANLLAILETAREMGLKVVWVRTTPVVDEVHNAGRPDTEFHRYAADGEVYNAIADGVMRLSKVPSIDLYTFTRNLGPDVYCDHVHFHEPVREKQAAYIAGWLDLFTIGQDRYL